MPATPARYDELPASHRHDWDEVLSAGGLTDVRVESRPEWHEAYVRVFRAALAAGDPGDDAGLAALQAEARIAEPLTDLSDRVVAWGRADRG
jgi:hypothetical protein